MTASCARTLESRKKGPRSSKDRNEVSGSSIDPWHLYQIFGLLTPYPSFRISVAVGQLDRRKPEGLMAAGTGGERCSLDLEAKDGWSLHFNLRTTL